jgi:hypothetical protein
MKNKSLTVRLFRVVSRVLGQRERVLLVLLSFLFSTACTLDANLSSLFSPAVIIKKHEILETTTESVWIRLDGQCPASTTKLTVVINGEVMTVKTDMAELVTSSAAKEIIAKCDGDSILIQYPMPDPNSSGLLSFTISGEAAKGPIASSTYELNFERPQVPVPVVTTHNGQDFATNDLDPVLEGTCIYERITGLEYRIDGGAWQTTPCVQGSPASTWSVQSPTLVGNPPTEYLFEFRSLNSHSKFQTSDIRKVKVLADTVAPTVTPTLAGVLGGLDVIPDEWLGHTLPTVQWTVDPDHKLIQLGVYESNGTTLVCAAKWVPNTGSFTFASEDCLSALVDDHNYKLRIRSQDAATNISTVTDWFDFEVDLTPPSLALTGAPNATTKSNFAQFTWTMSAGTGSPLAASARCSQDGAPFVNCASGFTLEGLSLGQHSVVISISDVAGNKQQVVHTWTVDTDVQIPICHITSGSHDWINVTSASFAFNCTDNDGVRFVKCRIDDSSPWQDCDSFTAHTASGLASGTRIFQLQAQDNAGNKSVTLYETFHVDLVNPVINWTTVPDLWVNQTSALLEFLVIEIHAGIKTTECILDSGSWTACTSPRNLTGLAEGSHSMQVRVTDNAGNVGTSLVHTWNVDLTPPNAPIMAPNGDAGQKPTWSWVSGGNNGSGTYRVKLGDSDFTTGATLVTGLSHTWPTLLPFGSHTLYVQERDAAGNWSTTSSQTLEAKCAAGEYLDGGNCSVCPLGTYQSVPSFNTSCTAAAIGYYNDAPGAFSPQACPVHSTTLATGATSVADCLGDAGYYNCEDGTCDQVDAGYYSPALNNTRTACPANSFTSGVGTSADSLSDCLAGLDYYNDDGDSLTPPIAVGVGSYSPYRDDSLHICTNLPSNATSVIYSGSGGGSNNCPVQSVLTCNVGYIPDGAGCSDNSPNNMVFTNVTGADPATLTASNALTVNGFDGPLTATCNGCTDIAINGVWAGGPSAPGVMPGDTLTIRRDSAFSFSTDVLADVTLGVTTSSSWVITTRAAYSCTVGALGTIAHGASRTAYSEATPLPTSSCTSISETRTCTDGVLSGSFAYPTCANGCSATLWGDVRSGFSSSAYSNPNPAGTCASVRQTRTCTNGTMSGSFANASCNEGCTTTPWGAMSNGASNTAYSSTTPASTCAAAAQTRTCTAGVLSGSYSATTCSDACTSTPWGVLTHGSSRTGYSTTAAYRPNYCSYYAQTRSCSNGTLSGSASYNQTGCTDYCHPSYTGYCTYTVSGWMTQNSELMYAGQWCNQSGAPYYQTGAQSSYFVSNGPDGVNGTGDDIYSVSCYYSYTQGGSYDCNGNCN